MPYGIGIRQRNNMGCLFYIMLTLCVISGIIVGWIGIDLVIAGICRMNNPILYNIACGFLGGFGVWVLYTKYFGV